MISVGLVGAGYIGSLHAKVVNSTLSNARVTRVYDSVESKGRKLASEVGARYSPDLDEILDDPKIDAVAICTPTFLHSEMVALAAKKGKDIFCEKPLARSLEEADRMIEVTEKHGVRAFCGHVLRFWPVYVRAREIIREGSLGKALFAYCERLLTMPVYTEKAWNRSEKHGGGVALDVQIHDLDFVAWLMGRPQEVSSAGLYDSGRGGWAHIATQVKFMGGAVAVVQAGWQMPETFPFTMGFRIVCERGVVEWNFRAGKLLEQRDSESYLIVYTEEGDARREPIDKTDAFHLEWKYFSECVDQGASITKSTFTDGRNSLLLALSTMESAKQGLPRPVTGWRE